MPDTTRTCPGSHPSPHRPIQSTRAEGLVARGGAGSGWSWCFPFVFSAPQAAPPQPPQAPPTPIPSPDGKPYFRSGGGLEVLSRLTMVIGTLMIAFGILELPDGTTGAGIISMALGLQVVVIGGILAAILRLGLMLESSITHGRR